MELFSNGVWQRRFWFVVDAQNLVSYGMRPASEKAAFGWRRPALHAENAGDIDSLVAEMGNQSVSRGVIANSADGQDARTERREIIGGVGRAARHHPSFAM